MVLNKLGLLVENVWREITMHYETVLIDEFVIMPNHIHGIIWLQDGRGQLGVMNHAPTTMVGDVNAVAQLGAMNHAPTSPTCGSAVGAQFIAPKINLTEPLIAPKPHKPLPTLGEIVRAFKARASHAIKTSRSNDSALWQRNYYEHVVRGETDLHAIREYIYNNPGQWHLDKENPDA